MKLTREIIDWGIKHSAFYIGEYDSDSFCIRIQEQPFSYGPIDHVSSVWKDGDDTEDKMDGLCGTSIKSAHHFVSSMMPEYYGEHVALIAGKVVGSGEDEGEMIIQNPVVLEILK